MLPKVDWGLRAGAPEVVGETTLRCSSFAVQLRWRNGVYIWHTPVGIRVERGNQSRWLPVVDWTRLFLVVLGAVTLLVGAPAVQRMRKEAT